MGQLTPLREADANMSVITDEHEEAGPIMRVRDRTTREVVGYLYAWNNGRLNVMWDEEPRTDVVYER